MHLQLRKKHNVQKTTTITVTATGVLTTVTMTRPASMNMTTSTQTKPQPRVNMTTTTQTKSQPRVNMKSKLKEWWKSTYPAKCQQKRSQQLGQALALEILKRQRSDDAQRNSSGGESSSSSGSGTIATALKVSSWVLVCIYGLDGSHFVGFEDKDENATRTAR